MQYTDVDEEARQILVMLVAESGIRIHAEDIEVTNETRPNAHDTERQIAYIRKDSPTYQRLEKYITLRTDSH